jgi:hypothetical protein
LGVHLSWVGDLGGFWDEIKLSGNARDRVFAGLTEILRDRRAQLLLIATAATLFVSFILTQKPKASWREPAAYIIDHTRCDRREILFYASLPALALTYYLPKDRFPLKYARKPQ